MPAQRPLASFGHISFFLALHGPLWVGISHPRPHADASLVIFTPIQEFRVRHFKPEYEKRKETALSFNNICWSLLHHMLGWTSQRAVGISSSPTPSLPISYLL